MSMPPDIEAVRPPWVQYPGSDPLWGGWRQGFSEAWLREEWLPFWRSLDAPAREAFLQRWPPPDDQWLTYLTVFWV
jgi:hypothetical protein